jgi:molecular chaperone GrpE
MSKHPSHHEKQHQDKHCQEAPQNDETGGQEEAGAASGDPGEQILTGEGSRGAAGITGAAAGNPAAGEDPSGEESGGEPKKGGGPGAEGRIAELEAQLADYKDQLLRKAADGENFRKRMNREKQDAIDFANQSLLLDLIPILDDFDRAMQSAESSRDFDALYEGLGMIARRLASTLDGKWGLKSYISAGVPFDPNFHEALMMEKSSAVSEQTVQMDLLKGYTLKNRVIRSAKVKVLDPDPSAAAIEAPPAGGEAKEAAEGTEEKAAGPEAQA